MPFFTTKQRRLLLDIEDSIWNDEEIIKGIEEVIQDYNIKKEEDRNASSIHDKLFD